MLREQAEMRVEIGAASKCSDELSKPGNWAFTCQRNIYWTQFLLTLEYALVQISREQARVWIPHHHESENIRCCRGVVVATAQSWGTVRRALKRVVSSCLGHSTQERKLPSRAASFLAQAHKSTAFLIANQKWCAIRHLVTTCVKRRTISRRDRKRHQKVIVWRICHFGLLHHSCVAHAKDDESTVDEHCRAHISRGRAAKAAREMRGY